MEEGSTLNPDSAARPVTDVMVRARTKLDTVSIKNLIDQEPTEAHVHLSLTQYLDAEPGRSRRQARSEPLSAASMPRPLESPQSATTS